MKISVNGDTREYGEDTVISDVVADLDLTGKRIAIGEAGSIDAETLFQITCFPGIEMLFLGADISGDGVPVGTPNRVLCLPRKSKELFGLIEDLTNQLGGDREILDVHESKGS